MSEWKKETEDMMMKDRSLHHQKRPLFEHWTAKRAPDSGKSYSLQEELDNDEASLIAYAGRSGVAEELGVGYAYMWPYYAYHAENAFPINDEMILSLPATGGALANPLNADGKQ